MGVHFYTPLLVVQRHKVVFFNAWEVVGLKLRFVDHDIRYPRELNVNEGVNSKLVKFKGLGEICNSLTISLLCVDY